MSDVCFTSEVTVNFSNAAVATLVLAVLEVDDELQPERIQKSLHVEDNLLIV